MTSFPWLLLAAAGSLLAVLLHVGCIFGGARWYCRFGAGRRMVRLAEAGHWSPTLITAGITAVLLAWAAYALAAALHAPLPASRWVLAGIIVLLVGRAALGVSLAIVRPGGNGVRFWVLSSLACLLLGLAFAFGTGQAWQTLSPAG